MAGSIRRSLAALGCCILVAGTPGAALAWNAACHAFIARDLRLGGGAEDPAAFANRIYGANAFDLFNSSFDPPGWQLQNLLHDPASEAFLLPWEAASTPAEVAFAYGFASHNDAWGADSTAHVSGVTRGREQGWILEKAALLAPRLGEAVAQAGLPLDPDTLLLVSHILVEQGVDFLLVAHDPTLPQLLVETALARDPAVNGLLARAFAGEFAPIVGSAEAAAALVSEAELAFQVSTITYGVAMGRPDARALVAAAIGQQAEDFLRLPPGTGQALVPLIDWAIGESMVLCADDYLRELEATTGWVRGRLSSHGLAPAGRGR